MKVVAFIPVKLLKSIQWKKIFYLRIFFNLMYIILHLKLDMYSLFQVAAICVCYISYTFYMILAQYNLDT